MDVVAMRKMAGKRKKQRPAEAARKSAAGTGEPKIKREALSFADLDWVKPLCFLLCMALDGLEMPLGIILVAVMLLSSYKRDRYDFIIMFTLATGAYGILNRNLWHGLKTDDIALFAGFLCLFIMHKPPVLKRLMRILLCYFGALVVIAMFSDEYMRVQMLTMRLYMMPVYVFVPLAAFSGRDFEMKVFMRKLMAYALIIAAFYCIDCYILNGHILVPKTYMGEATSTFFSPLMMPFTNVFPRIYPPGLYIWTLCLVPVARYYKIAWWMWALILLALYATRTFTIITGFVILYVVFIGKWKVLVKGLIGIAVLFGILYAIDANMEKDKQGQSPMRIASSIDQFAMLSDAVDIEDVAEFGSGRIAQVIPKYELLREYDKELVGLGFLHAEHSTSTKFQITNEYYSDVEKADEVATGVEIIPIQIVLTIGYIGLLVHIIFLVMLCRLVAKLEYASMLYSVIAAFSWFGLAGFSGLIYTHGELLMALALAVIILANKRRFKGFGGRRGVDADNDELGGVNS